VHPWTSDQLKQWPLERIGLLVQRIISELNAHVVVVGLPEENARLAIAPDRRIIDLAAKTSLVQLAGVLQKCSLLISGDSGPVHLGSCVGLPVLALFRNDMQGKNATRWGPQSARSRVIAKNSLQEISVDEVFLKAAEMLAQDKAHAG
jgi:ADP-heptose:LPS heptosyltransferase